MKRLLLDQGLARSAAALLRQSGWDVVHVSEIGMSRSSDADILQRARAESRVCIALDADFHSLLATSGEQPPIRDTHSEGRSRRSRTCSVAARHLAKN